MKKPQVWAHRGTGGWDRQYAPENTMPAFEKAVQMGADGVEPMTAIWPMNRPGAIIHQAHSPMKRWRARRNIRWAISRGYSTFSTSVISICSGGPRSSASI